MKRWIKPATLFGENFKRYLAESKAPERPQPKQGIAIIPRADYD